MSQATGCLALAELDGSGWPCDAILGTPGVGLLPAATQELGLVGKG